MKIIVIGGGGNRGASGGGKIERLNRDYDKGIGISAENLERIFDPYFSTKQVGTQKGMGLGLSICFSIIKKHGGDISVESEVGKGTIVTIYLPAVPGKT